MLVGFFLLEYWDIGTFIVIIISERKTRAFQGRVM